jgi:hypothetical protein
MYPPAFHKQIDREDLGPSLSGRSSDTWQRRKRILGDGRRQGLRIASCPPRWQPALGWSPAKGEMTMMLENRAPRIFLGIFFAIFVAPALAHDPSHPELNEWFDRLASGKGPCCSLIDGLTVADPDWESKDGHYRVRLDGKWIDVPDDAVITEPNRAGRTMVWPMPPKFKGDATNIRCFMPGSMI